MNEYYAELDLAGQLVVSTIGMQGPAGADGADGDGSGGGGAATFLELTDTPEEYSAAQLIAANADGDGLVFVDAATGRSLLGLGTAATAAASAFATAAQGILAGTAVQPGDLATVATTGDYDDLVNLPSLFDGAYSSLSGVPSTFAPSAHTHPASEISDSTAAGRSVLTAADVPAIRTALSVYSQTQTNTAISDAIAALVGAAPSALDTLAEIADAINDDEDFAATINAAIASRLRLDAPGSYTSPQQAQGRDNLGLGTAATSDTDDFATAAHTHALNDLTNVATTPATDHTIFWSGLNWISRNIAAGDIKSGTFSTALIPNLSASKITSGTFDAARIPALDAGSKTTGKQGPGASFDGYDAAGNPDIVLDGAKVRSPVTEAGTVSAVYAVADQPGSVDVIVRHYAAADTTFASPTALGTLSISSAVVGSLGSLSQAVAVGDVLEFEIDGDATSIQRLAVRARI